MSDEYNGLSKLFDNTPRICEKCQGYYEYMGAGEYKCKECGNIAYDDYGKVRKYIDEHGPSPYHVVKKATGVDGKLVREYSESPCEDKVFDRKCLRCGCRIAGGRLCRTCQEVENRTNGLGDSKFLKNQGAKPENSKNKSGMHFIGERDGRRK
ncbi:MAG: hypothetical protein K5644_05930 [Lachnospiraceae bacterium]|nr:hypothetical protein [Lachnospiraceae bacterium]